MTTFHDISKADIAYCQAIMQERGPTYYWATKLFPQQIRHAVYILYAFYRVPDDIVDMLEEGSSKAEVAAKLSEWIQAWQTAIQQPVANNIDNPILRATKLLHKIYHIDYQHSKDFLAAMEQDLTKKRYKNYAELEKYMYGSAAVVGIMLTYVVGSQQPNKFSQALKYAEQLGYAMQLTNFLRDVQEDYQERDRIYIPETELKKFNVNETAIKHNKSDHNWQELMRWQIKRCRNLFYTAEQGIKLLNKSGQLPILIASRLYAHHLNKIRQQNYNVFKNPESLKLTTWEKLQITLRTTVIYIFQWIKNR